MKTKNTLLRWLSLSLLAGSMVLPATSCIRQPKQANEVVDLVVPAETAHEIVFPHDSGHLDLKRGYGAKGDGVTNDTAAFRKAARENSGHLTAATLWLDQGTYLVTDTIEWLARLSVVGRHRSHTIIKLKDNAEGFQNPDRPRAVIAMGSANENGDAMQNSISNVTIDVGKGNPGAIGIAYQSNNNGTVEDVTIKSGDGRGYAGLTTQPWPGPALVKNLRVEGFDRGIFTRKSEYELTFVDITLVGQRVVGWENEGLPIEIENLQSYNSVNAFRGSGTVVMIDSTLRGGASNRAAIVHNGDNLYLRNVSSEGYLGVLAGAGRQEHIKEHWQGDMKSLFPSPRRSLNLPVKRAPKAPYPPPETWVNVRNFKKEEDEDWSKAIQAAVDSGAETIYFPRMAFRDDYEIHHPISFRGNLTRIIGMRSFIRIPKKFKDDIMVRFEGTRPEPLIVEYLDCGSEQYRLPTPTFHQAGKQPLVIRHSGSGLSNEPNAGDVFLEDVGSMRVHLTGPINVWARELNIETEGNDPELVNDGGTLWLFGYKTEYQSTNIWNKNGAKTEMLGGLIYPVTQQWPHIPAFINDESSLSVFAAWRVYTPQANHDVVVVETRGGQTKQLTKDVAFSGSPWTLNYVGYPR